MKRRRDAEKEQPQKKLKAEQVLIISRTLLNDFSPR